MAEKCEICDERIERNELGKIIGSIVKVKKDKKNELVYICPGCQKKGKDKELKK